jgi:hypothetical protein
MILKAIIKSKYSKKIIVEIDSNEVVKTVKPLLESLFPIIKRCRKINNCTTDKITLFRTINGIKIIMFDNEGKQVVVGDILPMTNGTTESVITLQNVFEQYLIIKGE